MQAEQLLELELNSGFGEKIEAGAGGRKEIKLVFEFELESDDLATENNVKKVAVEKKDEEDHQQTREQGEMPVRVKMFQEGNQEGLEAGLTDESREGNTKGAKKFQSSFPNSTETESQGKFSTILKKWRRHNRRPFYKRPLNLDLKQYTIQFNQSQNLTLPTDFLKGNIFKQAAGNVRIVEQRGKVTAAKEQFYVKRRQRVRGRIKDELPGDGNPSSPNQFPNDSHGETKLSGGNSDLRSESDEIRSPPVPDLLLGQRKQVRGEPSVLRTDAKRTTQNSPTLPPSRSPGRAKPSTSALPVVLSSSSKPSLAVSAEEIAAYLLENCPGTRLGHIRRICAAFGVGQRKSRRGEALVNQLGGQIEDAIRVTKVSSRRRKRLKLEGKGVLRRKQSERQPPSLLSGIVEILQAPFRDIFRFTRRRFGRDASPK